MKETNARLKSTSQYQRGLGKKMKRYWKLLQKEEAKLNDEKRIWRANFKDYLTESEIVSYLSQSTTRLSVISRCSLCNKEKRSFSI